MRKTRIAAATAAVVLAISSVALANGSVESSTDVRTDVAASSPTIVDDSRPASTGPSTTTVTAVSTSTPRSTSTSTPASISTSVAQESTTTSLDDRTSTTFSETTSTTVDDSGHRDDDTRSVVSLELRTYTVGDAGTVTVEGMHLIAVDANAGWTVEIDEASSDRIRVEFERGEVDAEFELRSDGELRIRTHD